jgi:pyridoxamine 5'-phosphate oxidase
MMDYLIELPLVSIHVMITNLADIRKEYILQTLNETDVETDAIKQFGTWWQQAVNSGIDEVNAFVLATATPDGVPSARVLLLKAIMNMALFFLPITRATKEGRSVTTQG